jgi:phosphate starvation-inducible PhoH-like protein
VKSITATIAIGEQSLLETAINNSALENNKFNESQGILHTLAFFFMYMKAKTTTTRKPRKPAVNQHDESIEKSLAENFNYNIRIKKPFHFNEKHRAFYECCKDESSNIVFVDGSAGTAKSYIAVLAALETFKEKRTKQIIYIRSVVESASRSIGLLPGEIDDKFGPYAMPLIEKVREITDESTAQYLKANGVLQAIPVNFARGLTFNDSFVIIDEIQNMTKSEIVTILTRFGKNTRYVICGDLKQTDIGKLSGYAEVYNKFDTAECRENGIHTFKFSYSEIVRSKILKFIVNILEA